MVTITTVDNALDSLERFAAELDRTSTDALALKGALCWGWHSAAFLAHHRLRMARDSFDHWLWPYLEAGDAELDVGRDAHWDERQRLSLLQLLDILSAEELEILEPQFYQGWQDRTTRCRTLRAGVAEVLGAGLDEATRGRLLVLLAAYHRLLRLPAAVALDTEQVLRDLPALLDLVELLVDQSHEHAEALLDAVEACRRQLEG